MKAVIRFLLKYIPRPLLIQLSPLVTKVMPVLLKGDAVHCPICNSSFSKFMPYGYVTPRPNALCPKCLSLERHRLMWLFLNQKTDFFTKPHRVLHVAPEQVYYKLFKAQKNLDYVTIDLESPLADFKMNLEDLKFGDNEFDIIFCNHVLEHVSDDHKALTEMYRVLRPGGFAILQSCIDYDRATTYEDPNVTTPEEREREFWQKDHMRLYGMDYGERLKKAGFIVEENNFVNELPPELVKKYQLSSREIIFIGRK